MKPARVIGTGVLLLLFGAVAPMYAQQDQQAKPEKQQDQAKPAEQQHQQQAQAKPAQQEHQQQAQGQQNQHQQDQNQHQQQQAQQHQQDQNQHQQQQAQQHQQDQNRQQQADRSSHEGRNGQSGEQRAVWQDHRAHNWQSEHRDWQQRGGYNGYRIPEDRYRGHFGPDHGFRIDRYQLFIVGGYPRFQYGGLWFSVVDPLPEYWSDDWYDNDDLYINYSDDGYYLYNRSYPRDRIAISVQLD